MAPPYSREPGGGVPPAGDPDDDGPDDDVAPVDGAAVDGPDDDVAVVDGAVVDGRDPGTGGDRITGGEAGIDANAAAVVVEEDLDDDLDDLDELDRLDEVGAVQRQRDDYLDALRHLQADFENYKKRVAKQQADVAERAAQTLVEQLLPALDNADLALAHGAGEGIKQIWDGFNDALAKAGLERIDTAGEAFDPNQHDAVAHEPGEGPQEVAEVMRAGYRWKGRVVRPAMVKVRG